MDNQELNERIRTIVNEEIDRRWRDVLKATSIINSLSTVRFTRSANSAGTLNENAPVALQNCLQGAVAGFCECFIALARRTALGRGVDSNNTKTRVKRLNKRREYIIGTP